MLVKISTKQERASQLTGIYVCCSGN